MSNRSRIIDHRATLLNMDAPLGLLQAAVPSRTAAVQIGRARAMIRSADRLLAEALREQVDGQSDLSLAQAS